MRYSTVQLRRGRLVHAITEGAESPRVTLCRLLADGALQSDQDVPTCTRCLKAIATRARRSR